MTTIMITGASRGMGAHVARRLAERGSTVIAAVRDPIAYGAQLRTERVGRTLSIHPVEMDVTKDASVAAAAVHVEQSFGALDVLINNAGIPGTWADADAVGAADFADVLSTNVLGPVRVTHAFLPLLRRSETPRLVMVSSGMGSFAKQLHDPDYADIAHLPYPASKAALNMLTVQYAKALRGILVTAVDPGLTATEFTGGAGQSVAEGAAAIMAAALDTSGPSGRFVDRRGESAW